MMKLLDLRSVIPLSHDGRPSMSALVRGWSRWWSILPHAQSIYAANSRLWQWYLFAMIEPPTLTMMI
jgi:hypothetical protein